MKNLIIKTINDNLAYGMVLVIAVVLILLIFVWITRDGKGIVRESFKKSKMIFGKHNQQKYVEETSEKLKALSRLNDEFSFNYDVKLEYEFDIILKSSQQYARFDFKEYVRNEIMSNPEKYMDMVEPIIQNRNMYVEYMEKFEAIKNRYFVHESEGMSHELYRDIENELVESYKKQPTIDIAFFTYPEYRTATGKSHYHDMEVLWLKDIEKLIKEIDDVTVAKANQEKERSMMSNSLRYDVLKRDNFCCTICGRNAADGIKLHVDHIRPISKGGKTEMNNLRTLCDECNSGKSDKWDEDGLN